MEKIYHLWSKHQDLNFQGNFLYFLQIHKIFKLTLPLIENGRQLQEFIFQIEILPSFI